MFSVPRVWVLPAPLAFTSETMVELAVTLVLLLNARPVPLALERITVPPFMVSTSVALAPKALTMLANAVPLVTVVPPV